MSETALSPTMRRFVDFFGDLGPRWGLEADACKVHAYLYLLARPAGEGDVAEVLGLDDTAVTAALAYLARWQMVARVSETRWHVSGDPWEMLMAGLEQRRRQEIEPALATLRECRATARRDHADNHSMSRRIGAVLDLVEDLAAIDLQARRISPQLMRQMVGLSGRAARFLDRTFGGTRGRGS